MISTTAACNQNLVAENCQILEFSGQEDTATPIPVPEDSGIELDELEAFARAVNGRISANLSNRTRLFARTRRKARIGIHSISLACDEFFGSRGMSLKAKLEWMVPIPSDEV